ncbi:MAG TPA: phenylalanine 4-monooxygenase [Cytophagales bacterium]|nr:phenylalanine 4-monooxygenase [Cytophagales bacterium]
MGTLAQTYENYTAEDQEVWNILFKRQMETLPEAATQEFLLGLERINFTADQIPNFKETNPLLNQATGWGLTVVPGLVNDDTFFTQLSNKLFPATTWLRKMEEIDYLEEPDMFHDVFAHVPLLTNQAYVSFLEELSHLALEHINNPWAIELLSRIYWFTIEFGLISEQDKLRIYGAGILSSHGETEYSLSNKPEHHAYNVGHILDSPYRKDTFQTQYFIIDSYEQLYASIGEVEVELNKRPKHMPAV